ncbi:MAG: autotransporter-associated beta strand repeat-containing protein, partial [Planctomycetes bacterium]|nr:autotransporter-associated beta strand repeat-containing protein [Planctomycetota bacterium]
MSDGISLKTHQFLWCALAMVLCCAPAATAATKTWIGGTGQWDVSANWNPNGQPQAGNDVYLTQIDATDWTVTYYNTLNPTALLKSLRIDATGPGTMTLDMPNTHALNVTTDYVGYNGQGAVTQSAGTNTATTLYLGYNAGGNGSYTITGGTLSSSQKQYIGHSGTGTLNIQNSGQVSSAAGFLGYNSGSNGTATVDGVNSKWTSSSVLHVGYLGTGTLKIQNGGQVSSYGGELGYNSGSSGTVTVDGSGSKWTNSGGLYVGGSGTGTLSIRNRGAVSDTDGYLGGANGTVTVDGMGSRWTSSGYLFVGFSGTATLNIQNGGQVSNTYGYLGYSSGTSSAVTVDGSGSKWTNSEHLYVGYSGSTGTLNIQNGGQVFSAGGEVSGTSSAVTVDGLGSKWTDSGDLYVGVYGTGTLNIQNGGQVSNTTGYLGYYGDSSGTVTVDGSGSKWTNSGELYVGYGYNPFSTGTLYIQNGGQVSSAWGYLGYNSDSNGTVTVDGIGSKWTNTGYLNVGYSGTGTLNIQNGGQVFSAGGNVSGTSSAVSVEGSGSKWTNSSGDLYVGEGGTGTLNIQNGGQVSNLDGHLGYYGSGTATVDGSGSNWTNSGDLYFGYDNYSYGPGTGTLNILNGGQVSNTNAYLGYYSASSGTATVDGSGSNWTHSGDLHVGFAGTGTLNIKNGGQVSNTTGYVGHHSSSSGTVTVDGIGSKWTHSGDLHVGFAGTGRLIIQNGGQVSNTNAYLGNGSGSNGTVTVDGIGSLWNITGSLYVGGWEFNAGGAGSITVKNGGQLTVGGTLGLWNPDSAVTVSGEGQLAAMEEYVGGTFLQTSGTNTTMYLSVEKGGAYEFPGGNLLIGGGLNNEGTLDFGLPGSVPTAYLMASNALINLARPGSSVLGAVAAALDIGTNSLLIVPEGMDPTTAFGDYSNAGMLHTAGTTLTVGPGEGFAGWGFIDDHVDCQGAITASTGGFITLLSGLMVSGAGAVDLGTGDLYVNDSLSGVFGGSLKATVVYVGSSNSAAGAMNVQNGGQVSSAWGCLGWSSGASAASGTATVDGIGSKWTNSGDLYVGLSGTGTLNILNGGQVSNAAGYLGLWGSPSGTATVDGIGSKWTNSGFLFVGLGGTGTLNIQNGGQVCNTDGYLGYLTGFNGTATVDGIGSLWNNTGSLYVGGWEFNAGGAGSITVKNGGQLTVGGTLGLWNPDSAVTVSGEGQLAAMEEYVGGTFLQTSGTNTTMYLSVEKGGAYEFPGGNLLIGGGLNNEGTLDFGLPGSVPTAYLMASNALINLARPGSSVLGAVAAALDIGTNSLLIVPEGMDPTTAFGDYSNAGMLHTAGTTLTVGPGEGFAGWGFIDDHVDCQGAITASTGGFITLLSGLMVSGAGAVDLGTGDLYVNDSLSGVFGGSLKATVVYVGSSNSAAGAMNVQNGGQVSSSYGYLGFDSGSNGTATVDGSGSNWTSSGDLYVGLSGTGTLNVQNGGQVSNANGYLGAYSGSNGTATVDGSGSKWTNSGYLYVGYFSDMGTGTLNILNGGQVCNTTGHLGYNSDSNGTATVDGIGSLWNNTGSLYVGGNEFWTGGTGSVTVKNGGQLTVGGTLKMWKADSTVTVNGGTLIAGALAGSTGTIRITDPVGGTALTVGSDASDTFSGTILDDTGPGSLTKVGSGTQTLGGANTYSGGTKVLEGTLLVANTTGSGTGTGTVTVGAATLGGTGIISGPVILTGDSTLTSTGTLTLSNTLTISGDANQLPSGTILTSGNVTIDSGAVFIINGTLGGEEGSLIVHGTLMGKGTIGKAVSIEAGGVLSPGAPSTIQGMAQILNAQAPGNFSFEIGAANPDYASPSNSLNDLIRLTDTGAPFADATGGSPMALSADTVIDVYFLWSVPAAGEYKAEFFAATDFTDAVAGAAYQYWRLDPRGERLHNGN